MTYSKNGCKDMQSLFIGRRAIQGMRRKRRFSDTDQEQENFHERKRPQYRILRLLNFGRPY